jgi:cutinase
MFGMQNPICSAVTLIFARGTTEVGNMGTCVGPDLARELRNLIPSLSVQGVDYPANSAGDTRYGASGGPYMAMLAREARLQCPETKIVLVGYSQGARCLHGALEKSERPFEGGDVAAVVAFGDPLNGKEESFKGVEREDVLQVCGDSDERCQEGRVDLWVHGGHVSYGRTAEKVAEWIRRKVE